MVKKSTLRTVVHDSKQTSVYGSVLNCCKLITNSLSSCTNWSHYRICERLLQTDFDIRNRADFTSFVTKFFVFLQQ